MKRWHEFPTHRSEESDPTDWEREDLARTTDDLTVLRSLWDDPVPEVRGAARGQTANPVEVLAEAPVDSSSPTAREKFARATFTSRDHIALFLDTTEDLRFTDDAISTTLGEVAEQILSARG
ncbi:hypothetical protein [Brachybacterium sp. ACRRE]|uniref:hypothetical protein n=1 Tax=Brachybacterium sp. ACRRE TaxID=2918184 RepID=UPI001EF27642|nr:hypothetical protein [Brachybacterium sp. ACRRE]MCG7309675.1 hypothetical protein [Brachybacterium sp. ACRRE]